MANRDYSYAPYTEASTTDSLGTLGKGLGYGLGLFSEVPQGYLTEGSQGVKNALMGQQYGLQDLFGSSQAFSDFKANDPYYLATIADTGYDILSDPTTYAGIGLFTGSKKAMEKAVKEAEGLPDYRGFKSSSMSNYIEGYYGPSLDFYNSLPKALQKRIEPMGKAHAAMERTYGITSFLKDAVKSTTYYFSPEAKALYREFGVHPRTISLVDNALNKAVKDGVFNLKTPAGKKAIAQAQYQILVAARTGNKDILTEALRRVNDVSFLGSFEPYTSDAFKRVVREKGSSTKAGRVNNTSDKLMDQAFDYISQSWRVNPEDQATLFVKRASGSGGDHVYDAVRGNTAITALKKGINDFVAEDVDKAFSPEDMFEYLKSNQYRNYSTIDDKVTSIYHPNTYKKSPSRISRRNAAKLKARGEEVPPVLTGFGEQYTILNPSAAHAAENGLWLKTSGFSTSYTEGGMNLLVNMDKKGRLKVWVSDEQNFLENVPKLGDAIEKRLSTRAITISEPISVDIVSDIARANPDSAFAKSVQIYPEGAFSTSKVPPVVPMQEIRKLYPDMGREELMALQKKLQYKHRRIFKEDYEDLLNLKPSSSILDPMRRAENARNYVLASSGIKSQRQGDDQ